METTKGCHFNIADFAIKSLSTGKTGLCGNRNKWPTNKNSPKRFSLEYTLPIYHSTYNKSNLDINMHMIQLHTSIHKIIGGFQTLF